MTPADLETVWRALIHAASTMSVRAEHDGLVPRDALAEGLATDWLATIIEAAEVKGNGALVIAARGLLDAIVIVEREQQS